MANLVPPYGPDGQPHGISAAIEFCSSRTEGPAHHHIGARNVRRHTGALLNGPPAEVSDFVGQWVRIAEPARARAMKASPEHRQDICEHESVRLSLDNLMTFPWIASAVGAGNLKLHGCFFDIRSGVLERLGTDGNFKQVAE